MAVIKLDAVLILIDSNMNTWNMNVDEEEQILPIDEYTNYIRKYAVGLVWYSPLKKDEARYYMGLSSGKYMKNVIKTYRNEFDFSKVVAPFIDQIERNLMIGEK